MITSADIDRAKQLVAQATHLEDIGRVDEARGVYEVCVAIDDGSAQDEPERCGTLLMAWLSYGSILKDAEEYESAIEAAKRSTPLDEASRHAHTLIGRCYRKLNDFDAAEQAFRRSLSLKPISGTWVMLFEVLRRAGDRDDEAQACLEQALLLDPDDDEAHYNLGHVLGSLGNYDEAITHLERAIELDDNYGRAHAELGYVLYLSASDRAPTEAKRTMDSAAAHLERAVAIGPQDGWAHLYLADLNWRRRQYGKAAEGYKRLLEIWPDLAIANSTYGSFLASRSPGSAQAEALLRRGVELDPESAGAHYHLGRFLLQVKRYSEGRTEMLAADELGDPRALEFLSTAGGEEN